MLEAVGFIQTSSLPKLNLKDFSLEQGSRHGETGQSATQ
jgi:hypothetical protein